ncbi:hypothetical protein [Stutzerimonas stutzeri]|uniref:hypothetical protein n=1 Tax=Stutzerimonas stutzeri TaxID=316 RepID=UPI0018DED6AA|nr:hypothetical protein [Stutzerimonas stutzeri]
MLRLVWQVEALCQALPGCYRASFQLVGAGCSQPMDLECVCLQQFHVSASLVPVPSAVSMA